MNTRATLPLALVLSAFAFPACYDVDEKIVLKEDLSGAISMVVTVTAPEGERITREEFERDQGSQLAGARAEAEEQLPEGVRLREFAFDWVDERHFAFRMAMDFDHLRLLEEIKDPEEGEDGDPKTEPSTAPTASLAEIEVEEREDRWIVRLQLAQKAEKEEGEPFVNPKEYEGKTFRLRLESSARILSHNGEEKDGAILWEKKMTEIVSAPADIYAEWEVAK
ncbi:MAG: hypothetical protein HY720_32675 [Planctomycetes bacterium]|nr:hypothetical protein [Planctomycetota bacterium]